MASSIGFNKIIIVLSICTPQAGKHLKLESTKTKVCFAIFLAINQMLF